MDAVEFIKERNRMCAAHKGGCALCPANGDNCSVSLKSDLSADEQVKIVEEWSAAHPRKTRQREFLKQWPNVPMKDMVVDICPCCLDEKYPCRPSRNCVSNTCCADCRREFWMQEVE